MVRELEKTDEKGVKHKFVWTNGLWLGETTTDVLVNVSHYEQTDKKGKVTKWSWITNLKLTALTVEKVMKGARARWKIENESFNTLKNQGYNFEHNFGHGKKNLCTVLALLMMLAFWVDQIQQGWNGFFKAAWTKEQSKIALWEAIRAKFYDFVVDSMEMVYRLISGSIKVKVVFYEDSG